MKQIILLSLLAIVIPCMAQRPYDDNGKDQPLKLEEYIPDLKTSQRTRLDIITRRTEAQVKECKAQLRTVRDSIRMYMDMPGDQSSKVYPLFDRESQLIGKMSRVYYQSKLDIDAVLTPEQITSLHERIEKEHTARRAKSKEER